MIFYIEIGIFIYQKMTLLDIMFLDINNNKNRGNVMSKIISIIITFLNRINKFIWKIIIFLSKFIKVDEIKHLDDKPEDVKYRLFHVDEPAIVEPFVKIKHKDYKQLIKDFIFFNSFMISSPLFPGNIK